mmetsp:Transcript_21525/g.32034  ORF Transcript_21525/g.32034 Transcript_21525/m.32034 type:complete len:438 (+) Transcript_21525:92-1405(+)
MPTTTSQRYSVDGNSVAGSVDEEKGNRGTVYGKSVGTGKLWTAIGVLAFVNIVLFVVCFVLIARLDQRIDDNGDTINNNVISEPEVLLSFNTSAPAGKTKIADLFQGSGEWAHKGPLPYKASDVSSVACGGKIYVCGGLNTDGTVSSLVYEFDPIFETYTNLSSLPGPRYRHAIACVVNGNDYSLYVAGGFASTTDGDNGAPDAAVYEYSSTTGVWASTSTLANARGDAAMVAVGTKLYIVGGYGTNYDMTVTGNSYEVADTASGSLTWQLGANTMPTSRGDVKAAVIGTRIYVVAGWNDVTKFTGAVESLDTETGTWMTHASLPTPRGDVALAVVNGRLIVAGGEVWSGSKAPCPWDPTLECNINEIPVHDVDAYVPEKDYWTSLVPLPTARFRFDASSSDSGTMFVFGGHRASNVEVDEVDALYVANHPLLVVYQ